MKEKQKNHSQHMNVKPNNSSIKNYQIQNGSTKATSSLLVNGFLSQQFIVSKDKNQKIKNKNQKSSKKQNLFDLEKTLDINIEILRNYFKNTTTAMTLLNQDQQILEKLENIIKIYKNKKEIINKIKEKKSKNLIQLQINLEHKRKLEETVEKYKDSFNEDAVNNKDEYVKLFQKKFVEVEIYLKRVTAELPDIKRKKYYQNYKMDNFLILNTTLNKNKQKIIEDISKYDEEKKNLKIQNQKIKKEEVVEHKKDDEEEKEIKSEKQNIKKKNEILEEKYKKLIEKKKESINLLKQFIDKNININNIIKNKNEIKNEIKIESSINNIKENKNQIKYKKVEVKKVKNDRNNENKIDNEEENNKSILPTDMTKRMNSFMDLSIVLNDNSRIRENNVSRMWGDISAIGKKED